MTGQATQGGRKPMSEPESACSHQTCENNQQTLLFVWSTLKNSPVFSLTQCLADI